MTNLADIDLLVIVTFLIVVVAVGFWFGRGGRDPGGYFLAGRTLPWYLIGFSFYASNMSGASFVGLIGASYDHGVVVFNYEWTATVVLILFALFSLPVFLRAKLFTVPEYLEHRFDRRCRWLYSLFSLATLLFIDMAGALYAGSVVIAVVFPGVDLWAVTALLAGLAGGYAPIGAVFATEEVVAPIIERGDELMFFTYSAHPMACAVADKVLEIIERERLVERAAKLGEALGKRLAALEAHPHVAQVRGRGLMQAVELVEDPDTLRSFPIADGFVGKVVAAGLARGVFFYPGGSDPARDVACFGPPFTITRDHIEEMARALEASIDDAAERVRTRRGREQI